MKIWVDADSCPVRIRQITAKAGERLKLPVIFAANREIPIPKGAKLLVDKGLYVINDRGTIFTRDNINTYLSARNFMYELQANGLAPEKTNSFGKKEIQKFSNLLDSLLAKALKQRPLDTRF